MYVAHITDERGRITLYHDLEGPLDHANRAGLDRFKADHPGQTVKECFVLSSQDYHNSHQCLDKTGEGCCEICGGVIPRSPLDRACYGSD